MNFHIKHGFGVKLTAYEGEMIKEVVPKSFTIYDAHSIFVNAQ